MAQPPQQMQRLSSSDGPGPAPSARLAAARAELARIEAETARAAQTISTAQTIPVAEAEGGGPERSEVPADEAAPSTSTAAEALPEALEESGGDRPAGSRGGRRGGRSGKAGVPREDDPARAYDACLRLLGDRARSRGELAERLARREFSQTTIDAVLARLDREGLTDDADFADQWVHFRHRDGGKAKRALAQELRQKGVADEVAATALEQISGEDEAERAAELVRRKLARKVVDPEMDRTQREKEIRRLVGMLARKGYSPGLAYSVVKAEWDTAVGRDD